VGPKGRLLTRAILYEPVRDDLEMDLFTISDNQISCQDAARLNA
jgi:hypothetical protein